MKTVLGDIRNAALLKLDQAMAAEVVSRCVEAAARQAGCPWRELMVVTRGSPRAARARVVAMLACVKMGLSPRMTGRAFGRSRRAVQDALSIGRPGRARRDAAVMQDFEEVMGRIGGEL